MDTEHNFIWMSHTIDILCIICIIGAAMFAMLLPDTILCVCSLFTYAFMLWLLHRSSSGASTLY